MVGYDDHIPLQTMEKPTVKTHEVVISKKSKFALFFKTFITFFLSAAFTILLLVLFLLADGKSIDYTIAGLKIPSLVSLLLSIDLIFIASGISTAVSEYKWVVLRDGAKLSLVDVYDNCTRGLSGFSKALKLWYFDWVLVVAFLFHLGLLIVNPASQEILKPVIYNATMDLSNEIVFSYVRPWDIAGRSQVWTSGMPPHMNGLPVNGYITGYSFAQAATQSKMTPSFSCPNSALECRYNNVSFISNKMTCQKVSADETAIVNRGGTTPTIVVLKEYFSELNATLGGAQTPKALYSSDMFNRTYYDLLNYTAPMMPGLNTPWPFANTTDYDPQYRPYVGDQSFIFAYPNGNEALDAKQNYTVLTFKKCYFNSSLVNSTWVSYNGSLIKTDDDTVTPIVFDYDNVLGNNLALEINHINKTSTSIMVNAYLMQQALLQELIAPKYSSILDYMRTYRLQYGYNGSLDEIFESYMETAVRYFDYAFFQTPNVNKDITSPLNPSYGVATFALKPIYKVDKAACIIFCFSLFLPMVWWSAVWLLSIARMGGVGRGNSQVALLSMSLTPDADNALRGISLLDGEDAFKQGKDIHVRLGVLNNNNKDGRLACGLKHETNLTSLQK